MVGGPPTSTSSSVASTPLRLASTPVAGLARAATRGLDLALALVNPDAGLVASTRPGRGQAPRPGACIEAGLVSGTNAIESWRCPVLVTRATG